MIRIDHRNLLYMNNHGSRKVLQWKLDIQHYDAIIKHVPGVMNTPADVFSLLVEKEMMMANQWPKLRHDVREYI